MILYLTSAALFLVVSLNLFFRAPCPPWLKISGSLLILLNSLKYGIYQVFGGAFFAPGLSRPFLIAMEALYGSLIILFFLLLLWDVYFAGNWILAKIGFPVPARIPSGPIKSGLVVLALVVGCFGVYESVKVPEIKTVEITVKKLPPALDGFVAAQLSDLHIGPILNGAWLEKVVARTNSIDPDVILLTGDYVDGRVADLAGELAPLANLRARYGVFAVTGNHEYYWNATEWLRALKNFNVRFLLNEHEALNINGEYIIIAGLPDLVAEKFGHEAANVAKALADAPEGVRILLEHQPKNSRDYSDYVDLHLAGHTHGGLMFFLRPLIAKFNAGFVNGLYGEGDEILYVNSGAGLWNGFSNRVGAPSEITKIVLRSPGKKTAEKESAGTDN